MKVQTSALGPHTKGPLLRNSQVGCAAPGPPYHTFKGCQARDPGYEFMTRLGKEKGPCWMRCVLAIGLATYTDSPAYFTPYLIPGYNIIIKYKIYNYFFVNVETEIQSVLTYALMHLNIKNSGFQHPGIFLSQCLGSLYFSTCVDFHIRIITVAKGWPVEIFRKSLLIMTMVL